MDENVLDIGFEPAEQKKILVVDDDHAISNAITDILIDDYRVITAHTGREGFNVAKMAQPDLILMDAMMPDMGGFEAIRVLANDPATAKIPVIMVTGRGFDSSTVSLIKDEPNVVSFLGKPFHPKDLRAAVKAALARAAQ
jgi:DNA-binding response OmpR family regulator